MGWALLAWLLCPFIGRFFYPQGLARVLLAFAWISALGASILCFAEMWSARADMRSETCYLLPATSGAHEIEVAVPSQGSMELLVRGDDGARPERKRLERMDWSMATRAETTPWFDFNPREDRLAGDVPLVGVTRIDAKIARVHYRVPIGESDVLKGCLLVARHDRSAVHMLGDVWAISHFFGFALLIWSLGCLVTQGLAELGLRRRASSAKSAQEPAH